MNILRRNRRLLWVALLLSLVFCVVSCTHSLAAETVQPTQTITIPLTEWNELKENNEIALTSIKNSNLSQNEAQSLISKQQSELKEAKTIIKVQQQTLNEANKKLIVQSVHLNEIEQSILELKNEIKNSRETETRLRRQRNTGILGGVLGVGLVIGLSH